MIQELLLNLKGVERLFLLTGYTVDMLVQSKAIVDEAKKAGVKHIVHLEYLLQNLIAMTPILLGIK